MNNVITKIVTGTKIFIFSIVFIIMLIVFSPMLFTDKETYKTVNVLSESYSTLYTGGQGLEYAIVMQCVMDTADDFINSYQNENILKSEQYKKEYNAVKVWKDLKYNGKDKLLKNVSDIMVTFDYAPAKASSDLKLLFNSTALKTLINIKAIMYNIRFAESVLYTIFRLLSVLAVLGIIYLFIICKDIGEDYNDYDDDEEYGEFDEYTDNSEELRDEYNQKTEKEKFEESLRQRRIRMR